jgi:hypothetical protein
MVKYKITELEPNRFKCKVREFRYVIEYEQGYPVDGGEGFNLKFYLGDEKKKFRYNKRKIISPSEFMGLIDSIGNHAIEYGRANGMTHCVFKCPGRQIGDELDYPDNVRTRYFVRWFNRNLGDGACTIEYNRVVVKL